MNHYRLFWISLLLLLNGPGIKSASAQCSRNPLTMLAAPLCTGMPAAGTASSPLPNDYCLAAPAKVLRLSGYTNNPAFDFNHAYIAHYTGGSYTRDPDYLNLQTVPGAGGAPGPYNARCRNITSFLNFIVKNYAVYP